MPGFISDSPLARGLIRVGDEAITRKDDAQLRDYYAKHARKRRPGGAQDKAVDGRHRHRAP